MRIIGFDLDGVVFLPPTPFYDVVKRIHLDFFVHRLKRFSFIKNSFYNRIKINPVMAEFIGWLADAGHKIVIISGHSDTCLDKIRECLRSNQIYFDELFLRPDGQDYKEFKLEGVVGEKCDIYFEDRKDVVSFLKSRLDNGCQVIHYQTII